MTPRKALTIGTLLLLLTFLASALGVYDIRQQALELEGNRLYSTESFTAYANAHRILTQATGASGDLRVVKDLTDDGRVRAILAEDYEKLAIPIHAGRTFSSRDHDTALAGSNVALTTRDGVTYYSFEGRDYEVIGRLGLQADSLLAQDIVLNDPALFAAEGDEPLVVDGHGALEAYMAAFGGDDVAAMSGDTNRRTNVDFVSPLLLLFGTCIVAAGLAFTGVLANALLRPHTHVLHVLGSTHLRIFAAGITWLLGLWCTAAAGSAAFWGLRTGGLMTSWTLLPAGLMWQVGVLSGAFTLAFAATARGGARWS
ncbi:hypothetical protein [Cellulomonas cellasea]|uniref:MacB-like periplasmic core domain-containing protein n=1 Tax=Cellulomonas cellasea TaxID=43670 RepID=A0A7W4UKS8_9CELL|nr:hypothetical protein [Cellulomonas cellasea]MBB2925535.1 hypothetical protein [Cellulomonas cellasea]